MPVAEWRNVGLHSLTSTLFFSVGSLMKSESTTSVAHGAISFVFRIVESLLKLKSRTT